MRMVITIMLFNAWVPLCALARLASDASFEGPAIKLHSALVVIALLVWGVDACPGPPPVAP